MYLCDIHDITQQYYYLVWAYSKAHHSPRRADQQSTRFWITEIYIFTLNVEEVQLSYIVSKQQNYSFNLYPLRSLLLRSSLQQRHHQPHFTLSGFRKFGFSFLENRKTQTSNFRCTCVFLRFSSYACLEEGSFVKKLSSYSNYILVWNFWDVFFLTGFREEPHRTSVQQVVGGYWRRRGVFVAGLVERRETNSLHLHQAQYPFNSIL